MTLAPVLAVALLAQVTPQGLKDDRPRPADSSGSTVSQPGAATAQRPSPQKAADVPEGSEIQVRKRPARMGRNPATGEAIKIRASKKVAFRPAKELKEAV